MNDIILQLEVLEGIKELRFDIFSVIEKRSETFLAVCIYKSWCGTLYYLLNVHVSVLFVIKVCNQFNKCKFLYLLSSN